MERRQLEHFLAIVEYGSFTAAADALYLSQPSLSHSISALENDLGSLLFLRLPRGVRLTRTGEAFVIPARQILREFEMAHDQVQAVMEVVTGHLDFVAPPGLVLDPLAGVIGRFRRQHPGVLLRIHHAETNSDVYDAIRSGRAELGFSNNLDTVNGKLDTLHVSHQEFGVLLPPGHAAPRAGTISFEELLTMHVITGPPGTEMRDMLTSEAGRRGLHFVPAVEVHLRGGTLYLALAGAGAAVLPLCLVDVGHARGGVRATLRPTLRRPVFLVHRHAPLSPAAESMRRLILAAIPNPL